MNLSTRETAKAIVQRLQKAGFAAFWVGGCVRDFLLGREPQDFDIATDARPEQVEKLNRETALVLPEESRLKGGRLKLSLAPNTLALIKVEP